jgi:hypothetical protein
MSFFKDMLREFRERRLWPIAVVLLLGIVAVPVLLSKSAPRAVVPAPPASTPVAAVPSLAVSTSAPQSNLKGTARDPFAQQHHTVPASTGATKSTSSSSSSSTSTAGSTGASSGGSTGGSSSASSSQPAPPVSTPTAPTSITPATKAKPAPAGLRPDESYEVALSITNASGGLNSLDPLERLSVLPSPQQPLLTELGVLKGGKQVLFVLQPGTVVGGPGTCTPGPIDCQILSLAPDQTESISVATASGTIQIALFAITGISAQRHSSAAAAMHARTTASPVGRGLLAHLNYDALSLFAYSPNVGAVLDLRNLTVGGN